MMARAFSSNSSRFESDLFIKIQDELIGRYEVDVRLASEMASDLLEVLSAIDSNIEIFEKYFLH